MRKLLYLLFAMLLLGKLEAAHACVVGADDYEQSHARASTVVVGHIVRTEEAGTIWRWDRLQSEPAVEATFRVVGVLKGRPPAGGKVRLRADRTCNVDLLAGQTYAIFLYGDNVVWGPNEGTTRLWHVQNIDAKRLLEQLREQEEEGVRRVKEMYRAIAEGKVDECWVGSLDKEAVAKSTNIFVGHLTRTEEVEVARVGDMSPAPVVEGMFRVLEVLRGQAPPNGTVRTSLVGTLCPDAPGPAPSLVPGSDYIVFQSQDNFVRAVFIGHYSNRWPRWLEEYGVASRKAQ
jgi:hypothetical protein